MSFIKFEEKILGSCFYILREDQWWEVSSGGICVSVTDSKGYETDVYLFEDEEAAGTYARQYWEDCIEGDRETAIEILGTDTLLSWALGEYAGPGATQVRSLSEWLDLYLHAPEEHFEEGAFCVSAIGENIVEAMGFRPTVAYLNG